jgi:hypothetical protein
MAAGIRFICSQCRFTVEAWDEGNPYFLSDKGKPQFFYHPARERKLEEYIQQSAGRYLTGKEREDFIASRTGNMSDLLCLDCGNTFRLDLEKRKRICPRRNCKSKNVVDPSMMGGKICPRCKMGTFEIGGALIS